MLIIGAKGFAKEVLETQYQLNDVENLVFYDDVSLNIAHKLYNRFPILTSKEEAKDYFETTDARFTIGVGNPSVRKQLFNKFIELGGDFTSSISPNAFIGHHCEDIGKGCNILHQAIISNDVSIGIGCIVYFNAIITHDVKFGNFVEVSPGASLLGRCSVGDYSQIGSHATILPDVLIGKNVIVAAGALVNKDVPDNCMVAGIPAKIKKNHSPLPF